jgi:hypothetical protein
MVVPMVTQTERQNKRLQFNEHGLEFGWLEARYDFVMDSDERQMNQVSSLTIGYLHGLDT